MDEQNTPVTPRARQNQPRRRRRSGKIPGLFAAIIACVLCIVITAGVMCLFFFGKFGGVSNFKLAQKLAEVKDVVDKNYIGEVENQDLIDAAAAAMVTAAGDQWSYYMTPEEYVAYQMYSANEYAGIGVTIQAESTSGGYRIVAVTADSPADKAGLVAGDVILAVDGTEVSGKSLSEVQQMIRSKVDRTIAFTIRGTDGNSRSVNVDCTIIHTNPVSYEMLDGNIGYIQVTNFETGSGSGAVRAIDQLLSDGASALVFDMRGNPGGKLTELITLLDHILPEGDIFVSVDKSGKETVTTSDNVCVKVPMCVLVNGSTYSAAEFFAAALQEYEWATVVGEQTSGKGRSQTTIVLSDGSAVHISSAKYLTPHRVDLSEIGGLTPDIVRSQITETVTDPDTGEIIEQESDVDAQLQAAISALQ